MSIVIPNEHQALEPSGPELDDTGAFALERALVMMVDDEPINIEMTQVFLQEFGFRNFSSTSNSSGALNLMRMIRPQVLLLDIQMPELDGFAILEEMRADPVLRYIPTIVLTSAIDSETKLRALELGASDFLNKPVDASELVLRVRNTLAARAHQEYLIHFDRLTGLPNRQRCLDEIERAIRRAGRHGGAVMQIDVDRFTKINEALGPAAGDVLLKQIALRLGNCVSAWQDRGGETAFSEAPLLSRLDGDEFCVLLPSVRSIERVADFAARVGEIGTVPYEIDGREIFVTLSVGVATFPGDGDKVDSVIRHVGSAMHKAKEAGRNTCRFYAPDLNAQALKHLSLEAELRRAIERGELCMHYQPKVDVATGRLAGAEALVRWNHPRDGLLAPGHFIPIAEATGLRYIARSGHGWLPACRQS
jgi:diguanylate cyclase (GGDEF)-like protein